ncbi:Type IV leader peptidase family protein [Tenacibaculum sp. 190524A05c]|uniref:Type IV leader peptidase family protein n=2 Tax=Tenacibaculum platacis TaxID=3137852 RepID=A0ABP1ELY4_9FLAO
MLYLFLLILLGIFYQDIKERKVFIWLLVLAIGCNGVLYYQQTLQQLFFLHISINSILILILLLILFVYTKFKMKMSLFEALGLGDILFFLVFAIGFPVETFLLLFITSLLFSLIIFISLKAKLRHKTVPLAGFQALFLFLILFINLAFDIVNLYTI